MAIASGHLGSKQQPRCELVERHESPAIATILVLRLAIRSSKLAGMLWMSALVYGCRGEARTAAVGPNSTARPPYRIKTRSANLLSRAGLWVMKIIARPSRSR